MIRGIANCQNSGRVLNFQIIQTIVIIQIIVNVLIFMNILNILTIVNKRKEVINTSLHIIPYQSIQYIKR